MNTQSGRTMVEILAVVCLIGILTVLGSRLYAKAMNTLRANYIMQQVFIKANSLIENQVATRHKNLDVSLSSDGKLSYGYSFCSSDECKPRIDKGNKEIVIQVNGIFSEDLCKIFKDKLVTQEYSGLKDIEVTEKKLKKEDCPENSSATSMVFTVDIEFKKQNI